MKTILSLFAFLPLMAFGGESYFFTISSDPKEMRIEGEHLHLVLPIQKLQPPRALSISAYHQGLGAGRDYQIQVHLAASPAKDWLPSLNLDGEIIMDEISVSRPEDPSFASSFSLESDDLKQIERWCQLLAALLKVPKDRVEIDLTKAEQADPGQPAIRPESKSEGGDKPQPEAEGRSR